MTKVQARSKGSKLAARKGSGARVNAHDRRLLARAEKESAEGQQVVVRRAELKILRAQLCSTQHAVVRAPNREIPRRGCYGPMAALAAYDGIQSVIEKLDVLLGEVQS